MTDERLLALFPDDARPLLEAKGIDLVERLGMDAVRDVVCDVLEGVNLRTATESLTRRRISLLNAALLVMYLRTQRDGGPVEEHFASNVRAELQAREHPASENKVLWWMLGLTKKQIDNVLRADPIAWEHYIRAYDESLADTARHAAELYGELSLSLSLKDEAQDVRADWIWAMHFMTAVGSQTLATRGSEKSIYGKFFEKLILGGALHVLGLRLVAEDSSEYDHVYWLSSRGRKRESDATALFGMGVGVRFDIGFIGVGNSEISLDKVSRFEREIDIGGKSHYMHTIIIVDRIGNRSRIVELAEAIEGSILQMSANRWPVALADKLEEKVSNFTSPFKDMAPREVTEFVRAQIATAPFEDILRIAAAVDEVGDDVEADAVDEGME